MYSALHFRNIYILLHIKNITLYTFYLFLKSPKAFSASLLLNFPPMLLTNILLVPQALVFRDLSSLMEQRTPKSDLLVRRKAGKTTKITVQ